MALPAGWAKANPAQKTQIKVPPVKTDNTFFIEKPPYEKLLGQQFLDGRLIKSRNGLSFNIKQRRCPDPDFCAYLLMILDDGFDVLIGARIQRCNRLPAQHIFISLLPVLRAKDMSNFISRIIGKRIKEYIHGHIVFAGVEKIERQLAVVAIRIDEFHDFYFSAADFQRLVQRQI